MTFQKQAGAVRRFAWLWRFAHWMQNLPNNMTPPPFRLVQIGSAFWQSRALYVVARLDIATVLGGQPRTAEDIAARVAAGPDTVYRLLRLLAAAGVFEETAPRTFANNRLSRYLRTDEPGNVRAMILMHNSDAMSRPWYEQLEQGVRTGETPFELTHGQALFDYMDQHPDFDALFAQAMDSVEALAGDSFARDFDWSQFDRIIDLGGGKGSKSAVILKQHPRLQALVVDRASVIKEAERYWIGREAPDLLARLHFQAGDVFEVIPPAVSAKDIYLLSAVLHGFDDEACGRILGNLAAASADTGARAAIMELIVPETRADLTSATFDLQMFVGAGGRERTLAQWRNLIERSGWRLEGVVDLRSFAKILIIRIDN
ncbi:MAG: methyltransferase [Candidatus Competibacteraceae bacterium]|nr:methyltransferase [Candidatus Competibacteraceae bacterium]MBK7983809.1 methyltransferase [Candidatus Competibacteraceae bacterium]MBK9950684.1 methyltransferase [Candidatus Competibacteraceae bacterium]